MHLLLTDVVMPDMNGMDLAEQLGLQIPHLRTLYMSGYKDEAVVHRGVLAPGTHFLSKPFNSAQLTRMVRKVLEGEAPCNQANEKASIRRSTTNRGHGQEN